MYQALLSDIVSPSKSIRRGNKPIPFLSMSSGSGLLLAEDSYDSGNSLESAKIVRYGQLVAGTHMDEGSIWVQNIIKEGAVSRVYDVFDVDSEKVYPEYLNYALHTDECLKFYRNFAIGSNLRRCKVPWTSLKSMPVRIPELEEQKTSVNLMRNANSLSMLIDAALSKINSAESSLFLKNTQNSSSKTINKIADLSFGRTPTSNRVISSKFIPFISGSSDFDIVFANSHKVVDSAEKIIEPNSVLVTVRDPVGEVNISPERCAIGRGIAGITPKKGVSNHCYLYLALNSKKAELRSIAHGVIKGISPKDLASIELPYVDIETQSSMAKAFERLESMRSILHSMSSSVDMLKRKILQTKFSVSVVA